jgi:hypothetical protein
MQDTVLTKEDLEFLRQVTLLIGACESRMNFTKRDLTGASAYTAELTRQELEAAHSAMKSFIQDKKEGFGPK